jgi:hypothetical protein
VTLAAIVVVAMVQVTVAESTSLICTTNTTLAPEIAVSAVA